MVTAAQIQFPPQPFDADGVAETANRLINSFRAMIELTSKSCPASFQKRFTKMCYLIMIMKHETSPTAKQWIEQMEAEYDHFAHCAHEIVATIRTQTDQFLAEFEETDRIRLRPEILGSVSQWAEKNGAY